VSDATIFLRIAVWKRGICKKGFLRGFCSVVLVLPFAALG